MRRNPPPGGQIEPAQEGAVRIEAEGRRIGVSDAADQKDGEERGQGCVAFAVKIGPQNHGKVEEIQKRPLVDHVKEDDASDGD